VSVWLGPPNTPFGSNKKWKAFLNLTRLIVAMNINAISFTLHSKRFWVWQLGGALIYATPAAIRLSTGSIHLPILSMFMPWWVTPFVPGNIVEKILVNAFFPGAAGAIAGEILYSNMHGTILSRKQKYLARLAGALFYVAAWSLFQFIGYIQNINGSYGDNLFESPYVYPLNSLLASLSIFTPTIVCFLKGDLFKQKVERKKT
jgi:hypothetical protein